MLDKRPITLIGANFDTMCERIKKARDSPGLVALEAESRVIYFVVCMEFVNFSNK